MKTSALITETRVTYTADGPLGRGFAEGPREDFGRVRHEAKVSAGLAWPRFEQAEIINDGQQLAALVREFDGSVSAVRIDIQQVSD